ncbi:MAG TPA: FHA domain-containing protein [Gaiellaceae bacterium]
MNVAVEVDEALLALKIGFLVLLYLFIWLVVRSATRDLRAAPPQESIVLGAAEAEALRAAYESSRAARLVVLSSPSLSQGATVELTAPVSVGRGAENGLRIDSDDYVSSRHAQFEVRADGLWLEDAGSTNGTFVNGARVTTARQLQQGDVVRIGQTDLLVEAA